MANVIFQDLTLTSSASVMDNDVEVIFEVVEQESSNCCYLQLLRKPGPWTSTRYLTWMACPAMALVKCGI